MTSEVDQTKGQGQLFGCPISSSFLTQNFLRGGIRCSLTRFLFGVGSEGIDQDLSLLDPISLRGGISSFHLNDLLLPWPSASSIKDIFGSNDYFIYLVNAAGH